MPRRDVGRARRLCHLPFRGGCWRARLLPKMSMRQGGLLAILARVYVRDSRAMVDLFSNAQARVPRRGIRFHSGE
jgi:hypothetical protein